MNLAELERLARGLDAGASGSGLCFGDDVRPVLAVTEDSRRARPGSVFVAVSGGQHDGHEYAAAAVAAGALAILGDRAELTTLEGVPYLFASNPRAVLGVAAHALAGDPTRRMSVVGVTGTNGKSSIVTLTRHVLRHAGHKAASFGTLGYVFDDGDVPAPHTTPFAEDLAALFARGLSSGHTHVAMEVSSHALAQDRIAGIEFDIAVFTNLTQDHLDYHTTMDEYREAKLRLFRSLHGDAAFAVVNREDPSANFFIDATSVRWYTYGAGGDCSARDLRPSVGGTAFTAVTPWGEVAVAMKLVGLHNVSNVLAVMTVCGGLGVPLATIAEALAAVESVPGRFERVDAGQPFQVIVDYAHTEDGLRNVLRAAREICGKRVLVVFGCGGDRDRTKRPKMAGAVAELGDYAVVTSDNPRTEDPQRILLDIESGMRDAGKKRDEHYVVIEDRRQAIDTAIAMARPGDLVMIAGKGHEDYQILGTERVPFDDRVVARNAIEAIPR